eukprot:PRCOL_00003109-RA
MRAPAGGADVRPDGGGLQMEKILGSREAVSPEEMDPAASPGSHMEYLIKRQERSFRHAMWVRADRLRAEEPRKLANWERKHGYYPVDANIPPDWRLPRRVVALDSRSGEVLVKWQGLGYDELTWEAEQTDPGADDAEEYADAMAAAMSEYRARATKPRDFPSLRDTLVGRFDAQPAYVGRSKKEMMPHQLDGLNWMVNKFQLEESCILGDEMGLGKTIQSAALVSTLIEERLVTAPILVVAPLSTLTAWDNELRAWCPEHTNIVVLSGGQDARSAVKAYELGDHSARLDVLVTNYELVSKEGSLLRNYSWSALIVDEGHRLKKPDSLLANELRTLRRPGNDGARRDRSTPQKRGKGRAAPKSKMSGCPWRILLTGTPLQNSLNELFCLLSFLDDVRFADPDTMAAEVAMACTQDGDGAKVSLEAAQQAATEGEGGSPVLANLQEMLAQFMFRRLKRDVFRDMPARRKLEVSCGLSSVQRQLYGDILSKNLAGLNAGMRAGARVGLMNALKQLQKVCNHPWLFPSAMPEGEAETPGALTDVCGKLVVLKPLLDALKARGHRVLIFCQMTTMLNLLEDFARIQGHSYVRLDGSTPPAKRQQLIDAYNAPGSPHFLFMISTRAGGLGINLQSADTVVLYDPDFNPFMDLQAQARAHRYGQKKEVMVYQLVTAGSVEERIIEAAKRKMEVEKAVTGVATKGGGGKASALSSADLRRAVLNGARGILSEGKGDVKDLDASLVPSAETLATLLDRESAPDEEDMTDMGYLGRVGGAVVAGGDPNARAQEDEAALQKLLARRADALNEEVRRSERAARTRRPATYNLDAMGGAFDEDDDYGDGPKRKKGGGGAAGGGPPFVNEMSEADVEELIAFVKATVATPEYGESGRSGRGPLLHKPLAVRLFQEEWRRTRDTRVTGACINRVLADTMVHTKYGAWLTKEEWEKELQERETNKAQAAAVREARAIEKVQARAQKIADREANRQRALDQRVEKDRAKQEQRAEKERLKAERERMKQEIKLERERERLEKAEAKRRRVERASRPLNYGGGGASAAPAYTDDHLQGVLRYKDAVETVLRISNNRAMGAAEIAQFITRMKLVPGTQASLDEAGGGHTRMVELVLTNFSTPAAPMFVSRPGFDGPTWALGPAGLSAAMAKSGLAGGGGGGEGGSDAGNGSTAGQQHPQQGQQAAVVRPAQTPQQAELERKRLAIEQRRRELEQKKRDLAAAQQQNGAQQQDGAPRQDVAQQQDEAREAVVGKPAAAQQAPRPPSPADSHKWARVEIDGDELRRVCEEAGRREGSKVEWQEWMVGLGQGMCGIVRNSASSAGVEELKLRFPRLKLKSCWLDERAVRRVDAPAAADIEAMERRKSNK